jgi:hypothetical protein
MGSDDETRAAQQGFGATSIGNPPIRWIVGVAVFDEVQFGKFVAFELVGGPEIVILVELGRTGAAPLHRLK